MPFNQISLLSDVVPALNPTLHKFNFKKNNEETKVGELVKYWTISPAQLIETDFSRLLSSKSKYHNITFKYKLQSSHGVNCLVRADHGAGKSRYLVRVNYLPSSARCQKNWVDYGTWTYQFAKIDCKKDTHEIQNKVAPVINAFVEKIKKCKLVAFKSGKEVQCLLLPKQCTSIHTSVNLSTINVHYNESDKITTVPLNIPPVDLPISYWTAIPSFDILVTGDLSFYATATGCDGHSHCRCVYCDSTYTQWNDDSNKPTGNPMSLSLLNHYAKSYTDHATSKIDTKGVVMKPQLNIEPTNYIVPLLIYS